MVKNISVRNLRQNLAKVVDEVRSRMDRYVILKRGQPAAILMCVDDYDGWLETLEIMSSKQDMEDIRIARKELSQGKGYSVEEVFGKHRKIAKRSRR